MERFKVGTIVIVDWRGGTLPKEPNKLRAAVVVEDDRLFGPNYPNVIVVPLTEDAHLAMPDLSVVIDPTAENGCTKRCYALAPSVGSVSMARVRGTASRVTDEQVRRIRMVIAETIGVG
jgi:mRNA-degrading endonuclease toxin of MazEF toxin-antitoxin module